MSQLHKSIGRVWSFFVRPRVKTSCPAYGRAVTIFELLRAAWSHSEGI